MFAVHGVYKCQGQFLFVPDKKPPAAESLKYPRFDLSFAIRAVAIHHKYQFFSAVAVFENADHSHWLD